MNAKNTIIKKVKFLFYPLVIITVLVVFLMYANSCKKDSNSSTPSASNPSYSCQSSSSPCGSGTFQTCCNGKDCYYTYKNKKYSCNGTDCNSAAQKLASDMCKKKKSDSEPLSDTENELLESAKTSLLKARSSCPNCK